MRVEGSPLLGIDLQRRSRQIQCTPQKLNRLMDSQDINQRAFAHERGGVEPEMLWHQVMRPNERGWRVQEGESAREDVLCMCTLHVPTQEKGGCVERRGGMERAFGCIGFWGERNSGPQAGFDHVRVPDRGAEEHWNHEEGRKGRRARKSRCPSRQC